MGCVGCCGVEGEKKRERRGVVVCAVTCGVLFFVCCEMCGVCCFLCAAMCAVCCFVCVVTCVPCVVFCVLRDAWALKRLRVYVENAPVCACLKHAGVSDGTHGVVSNVHTGTRTPTPPHITHHPHMQPYPHHRQAKNGQDKQRTSGRRDGRQKGMNDGGTVIEGGKTRQREPGDREREQTTREPERQKERDDTRDDSDEERVKN